MRAGFALIVLAQVALVTSALAAGNDRSAPPVTSPNLLGLSTLAAGGAAPLAASTGQTREREVLANLPSRARSIHAVLAKGGELPLADGSLVAAIQRDGRVSLTGPVSSRWVEADRALLYGGELSVDDGVTLVVRNEQLVEARIREGDTTYVLSPPSGQTVRAVGIYRESPKQQPALATPSLAATLPPKRAATLQPMNAERLQPTRAATLQPTRAATPADDNPYAGPSPLPLAVPFTLAARTRASSTAGSTLSHSGARSADVGAQAEKRPPTPGTSAPNRPTPPEPGADLATLAPPATNAPPKTVAEVQIVTRPAFAALPLGPPGPVDAELRAIADIEARLREARSLHAALLMSDTADPALTEMAGNLDLLEQRVVTLWKEADAVLHVSHRLLPDDQASLWRAPNRSAGKKAVPGAIPNSAQSAVDESSESASSMPTSSH
jgi:hypothetical protein